jgi:hypothetical protein
MPIDPNIALSVKGIEVQDPLVQYGKIAAIQNAQNQNALAQYKLGAEQRAENVQNVLSNAYAKSIDPITGKIDYNKLNSLVASGGAGSQLPAIQKSQTEMETAALTRQKTMAEVLKAKQEFIAQVQRDTSQNPSDANITAYKEDLMANPMFSDEEKQKMFAGADRILAMPFEQRKAFMASQGAKVNELKPTVSVGRTGIVQTPAFGGAATVVPGTEAAFQATPGERMADARARAQMAQAERHFQAQQANPSKEIKETEQGLFAIDKKTGAATPVTMEGKPLQAGKALTEYQGKSTGFALRAKEAHDILGNLDYSPAAVSTKQSLESYRGVGGPLGVAANVMMSPQSQQADQAQRNFVNAILRQESGAAISESEFQNARKQYFPQPGDSAKVIEQKRQNRETAIKSLEVSAGPGMKKIQPLKAEFSDMDKQALEWANANPNDPRAAKIKQKLGAQ